MAAGTRSALLVVVALAVGAPGVAGAKSHLWRFTEFFSSADRQVQFVEMQVMDPAGTGEWHTGNWPISSNANVFVIPSHLPQENTFLRYMLVATQAFADLPGAPTPDFIMPPEFFVPAGDELRWRDVQDIFTIPPGAMPVDGTHSLQRSDLSTPVNSPTNFAGETGSVVVGIPVPAGGPGRWLVIATVLLAIGSLALVSRRSSPQRS